MSAEAKAALRARTVELGRKFLQRTVQEASLICADLQAGSGALERPLQLAHKIRGAAATFGFPAISDRAAELEDALEALSAPPPPAAQLQHLATLAGKLQTEAQLAASQAG